MSNNEIDTMKLAYRDFIAKQFEPMVAETLMGSTEIAEQAFRGALRAARQARDKAISIIAEEDAK